MMCFGCNSNVNIQNKWCLKNFHDSLNQKCVPELSFVAGRATRFLHSTTSFYNRKRQQVSVRLSLGKLSVSRILLPFLSKITKVSGGAADIWLLEFIACFLQELTINTNIARKRTNVFMVLIFKGEYYRS